MKLLFVLRQNRHLLTVIKLYFNLLYEANFCATGMFYWDYKKYALKNFNLLSEANFVATKYYTEPLNIYRLQQVSIFFMKLILLLQCQWVFDGEGIPTVSIFFMKLLFVLHYHGMIWIPFVPYFNLLYEAIVCAT